MELLPLSENHEKVEKQNQLMAKKIKEQEGKVTKEKEKSEKAQKIYQTQSLSALTYIEPHIYIQIFPLIQSLLRFSQF